MSSAGTTERLHRNPGWCPYLPRPSGQENCLEERVKQAKELGVSYGVYMAMLYEGRIEDPLMTTPQKGERRDTR